jgi:hypothetical protein
VHYFSLFSHLTTVNKQERLLKMDFMRETFGSAWAYLLAFGILFVWWLGAKLLDRDRKDR